MWRISLAHARPMPAISRWSRSSACSRRDSPWTISPSRSGPSPSASGPRCASSASAASGVSSQTPARFFLAFSVRTSFEPPWNSSSERRRLRPFLAGLEELESPGCHQVDVQHELAVVGGEEQALAAPLDAAQATALERVERRVERLQRRDVRRSRLLDREGRHGVVQLAPPRLHLRELGHAARLVPSGVVDSDRRPGAGDRTALVEAGGGGRSEPGLAGGDGGQRLPPARAWPSACGSARR